MKTEGQKLAILFRGLFVYDEDMGVFRLEAVDAIPLILVEDSSGKVRAMTLDGMPPGVG